MTDRVNEWGLLRKIEWERYEHFTQISRDLAARGVTKRLNTKGP